MKPLFIDIETAPAPEGDCLQFAPDFAPPKNLKDPTKIAEAVEAKRKAWQEDATLDPKRSYVLAVGMMNCTGGFRYWGDPEPVILNLVLTEISSALGEGMLVVGHNLLAFDLPFLVRRAWKLGIHVPADWRRGRYWNDQFVDTMDLWRLGVSPDQGRISLDHLAKHLGVGAKTGDGADFHVWWAADRAKALAYLENDLKLTRACYERMTA